MRSRFFCALVMAVLLAGCAARYGVTENEHTGLGAGDISLVLLRVRCLVNGKPYDAFPKTSLSSEPIFMFGLGGFDTVGEPEPAGQRFLSEDSGREGWLFFLLPPGVHYLAVLGPDSSLLSRTGSRDFRRHLQEAPRWKIDLPANSGLVYAGTLVFNGRSDGTLLFGNQIIRPADSAEIALEDESGKAAALLAGHFPGSGNPKTVLMQRWRPGEPLIIRSPLSRTPHARERMDEVPARPPTPP